MGPHYSQCDVRMILTLYMFLTTYITIVSPYLLHDLLDHLVDIPGCLTTIESDSGKGLKVGFGYNQTASQVQHRKDAISTAQELVDVTSLGRTGKISI